MTADRSRIWLGVLAPLVLLGVLLWVLASRGPADALRGDAPPVERLSFQRVTLDEAGIHAGLLNDGPDPITIAQVAVDDAFWAFRLEGPATLSPLGRTRLTVPYPWVHGETHRVKVISATGVTFEHEIGVAVPTPSAGPRMLGIFALIGLYVGVLPVAIGLLWYPVIGRLGRRGLDFVLALTIGLLLFLLVDAVHEGLESAGALPGAFQGFALFVLSAAVAYLALESVGAWLRERRHRARGADAAEEQSGGWVLALLIAVGIGLHNFGEGLAIGAAFALGEAALGSLLIIGFTLHNTTEGLAIVAPLARERVRLRDLVRLGLIGGVPTIAGAWLGGLLYSPVWSVIFLAVGAGAIAQVVAQLSRQLAGEQPIVAFFSTRPALAGLLAGFAIMYSTGMLVS